MVLVDELDLAISVTLTVITSVDESGGGWGHRYLALKMLAADKQNHPF